jgi:hypothetical protein
MIALLELAAVNLSACGRSLQETGGIVVTGAVIGGLFYGTAKNFGEPTTTTTTTTTSSTAPTSSTTTTTFSTTTTIVTTAAGDFLLRNTFSAVAGFNVNYTSLALDQQNNPRVIFCYQSNFTLEFANRISADAWAVETVEASGPADQIGEYASIAVDQSGTNRICFYDRTLRALVYAKGVSGAWQFTTVDHPSGTDVGYYSSLALDSHDNVHICYYDLTNEDLKYATNKSGAWQTEIVAGAGITAGKDCSIAIDPRIKHAWGGSGQWRYDNVDFGTIQGAKTAIKVDGLGQAHVIYYDQQAQQLLYAKKDTNSIWTKTIIDNNGNAGRRSALALDNSGNPRILFYDANNIAIKYARWNNGAWTVVTLGPRSSVGGDSSMTIGADGKSHICYYDDNYLLKYAVEE